MCGIAGKVRLSGKECSALLRRMADRMAHRGPDHTGVLDMDGVAGFSHTRLSIIDLSPAGHQPMTDPSGRYTITYNGEVYNFQGLREELTSAGYKFRSGSDTEVVLNLYIHLGTRAFSRMSGMFALAIWDRKERELILCRDRFGKKPLYYAIHRDGLSFASECSALILDPDISKERSIAGLNHYFALGYILSPHTIYRDVAKLEPATFLRYRNGSIVEKTRYWDYLQHFAEPTSERASDIIAHLDYLIDRAVKMRLVSDVPIGAFLSGGIDSSGIVAIAKKYLPYDLHTFTIGFAQPSYNEASDAQVVADYLRTVHHERILTGDDRRSILHAIGSFDEPFSDTSLIPTYEVAKAAARYVKVVLSGDGADELFGGYPTYQADALHRYLSPIPRALRRLAGRVLARAPLDRTTRTSTGFKLRQFGRGIGADHRYAHYSWRELHTEEQRIALIGRQHAAEVRATHPFFEFERHYEEARHLDALSQHLYVDAKTWLEGDVLVKVDRATMAASIEARTPFLDHTFAEYVASIPSRLKLRGMTGKYILKRMFARHLPRRTLMKKKAGFNAPVGAWLGPDGWLPAANEFTLFNEYVATRKGLWART